MIMCFACFPDLRFWTGQVGLILFVLPRLASYSLHPALSSGALRVCFLNLHTGGPWDNEGQEERDGAGIGAHRSLSKVAYERLGNDASSPSGSSFFVRGGRESPSFV